MKFKLNVLTQAVLEIMYNPGLYDYEIEPDFED